MCKCRSCASAPDSALTSVQLPGNSWRSLCLTSLFFMLQKESTWRTSEPLVEREQLANQGASWQLAIPCYFPDMDGPCQDLGRLIKRKTKPCPSTTSMGGCFLTVSCPLMGESHRSSQGPPSRCSAPSNQKAVTMGITGANLPPSP